CRRVDDLIVDEVARAAQRPAELPGADLGRDQRGRHHGPGDAAQHAQHDLPDRAVQQRRGRRLRRRRGAAVPGLHRGDTAVTTATAFLLNNPWEFSVALAVTPPPAGGGGPGLVRLFAVGADPGAAPLVRVYNADGSLRFDLLAYGPGFAGGVRVATGDVTGDG